METIKSSKLVKRILISMMTFILIISCIISMKQIKDGNLISANQELLRAMTYEQFEDGDEKVEGTDNVEFSAFFLRDIDNDGYADKLKGTCKEVGKEDTLYMELNVLTEGKLKDGKIELSGDNFYLQTTLPKDNEIKNNYIGNNIKEIELNDIENGTQKMLIGIVRSGDYSLGNSNKFAALNNNSNNYSKVNKVVLTGTYVIEEDNEIIEELEIRKEIELYVDWYGVATASFANTSQIYSNANIANSQNDELNLSFSLDLRESKNELLLKDSNVVAEIPQLNGYDPTNVVVTGTNINYEYDATTRKLTIIKNSEIDDNGKIIKNAYDSYYAGGTIRYNGYSVKLTYPLEAYEIMGEGANVSIQIPVTGYYNGYNNQNSDFTNPYKTNVAEDTYIIKYQKPAEQNSKFSLSIGNYMSKPTARSVISKKKPLRIYNEVSSQEINDTYKVEWDVYTGTRGEYTGITMKETPNGQGRLVDQFLKSDGTYDSMENVTTNKGIYFVDATSMLGDNGWIKIYDDETDILLVTFGKNEWSNYTSNNPYYYDLPVKHIRVETSATNALSHFKVYCIKELDDEYITENYTRQEFDKLIRIKTNLVGYLGENLISTLNNNAIYEEPYGIADIYISNNTISTQSTEMHEIITINAEKNENYNQVGWVNGIFLIKMPESIFDLDINSISINNANVDILTFEKIENEGINYIKIITANNTEQSFKIFVDCNITPDPRIASETSKIELYAFSDSIDNYYYNTQDIYDLNGNQNTSELVNIRSTSINLISPNSLLTNQSAHNYDEEGTIIIAPKVAILDKERRSATVSVEIKNNYKSTISEVLVLGRVPYEGNKYVINGREMGSNYSTTMTDAGISIPTELEDIAVVYYSENGEATKDLSLDANGWTTEVDDFSKVKSYLIVLEGYALAIGESHVVSYEINIPEGLSYNQVSYSHHAVFFSLDTEEGKYRTQTEPNKIGFMIARQYDLEVVKYQKDTSKKLSNITFSIQEDGEEEAKTRATGVDGSFKINGIYLDRVYTLKEIIGNDNYELNEDEIKFIGRENNSLIEVELLEGNPKSIAAIQPHDGEDYKVQVDVEDEVRAKLKLMKKEKDSENGIPRVKYKITGKGLPSNGRIITTNSLGEANLSGLYIGEEYVIEETKADGYYLATPITFTIQNNGGVYSANIIDGDIKSHNTTVNDDIPTINFVLEDEKMPKYNLEITKIKHVTNVATTSDPGNVGNGQDEEITYLEGAKFKLYKNGKDLGTYTSDENGKIIINGLYAYEEDKDVDQTYILKEVNTPDGYAKVKDIRFKVSKVFDVFVFEETIEEGQSYKDYNVEDNLVKVIVEDSPSFKLTKKDSETDEIISNVKFAIYNVDDTAVPARNSKGEIIGESEIINGKEYYTVTTDANGELTADLPEGLYKAVEVEAPEKYDFVGNEYYFGIGTKRAGNETYDLAMLHNYNNFMANKAFIETDDGYMSFGSFSGTIDINGEQLISENGSNGLMVKYNKEDEIEWMEKINESGSLSVTLASAFEDGSFIVGANHSGDIVMDGVTYSTSSSAGIVIKYDVTGNKEWIKTIENIESDNELTSIYTTQDNGFLMTFNVGGRAIFNNEITFNTNGGADGVLVKFNSAGEIEWYKQIGGDKSDYIKGVTETSDKNIVITGRFISASLEIDGEVLLNTDTSGNTSDAFTIKLNQFGDLVWAKNIGSVKDESLDKVVEIDDGSYILGGYLGGTFSVEEQTITFYSYSTNNPFIIKYTKDGHVEWLVNLGKDGKVTALCKNNNNGFIVGYQNYTFETPGYSGSSNSQIGGFDDAIVAEFDTTGKAIFADFYSSSGVDAAYSVGCLEDGTILFGGYLSDSRRKDRWTFKNKYFISVYKKVIEPFYDINKIDNTIIRAIENTEDNGFIYGTSSGVYKADINNTIEWKYSGIDTRSIIKTSDGGYLVGGSFKGRIQLGLDSLNCRGSNEIITIKLDGDGNVEWYINSADYRGSGVNSSVYSGIVSMSQLSNGDFVAIGTYYNNLLCVGDYIINSATSDTTVDSFIMRISPTGEVKHVTNISESNNKSINAITYTNDGGYVVGGTVTTELIVGEYSLNSSNRKSMFIIKYNSNNTVEWARDFSAGNSIGLYSIINDSNGNFIISGNTYGGLKIDSDTIYTNSSNSIVITLNSRGEVVSYDPYNIASYSAVNLINKLRNTSDGGWIGVGRTSSICYVDNRVLYGNGSWIVKYDKDNNVEWTTVYKSESELYDVLELDNGNYIICGSNGWYTMEPLYELDDTADITAYNTIKKYKITTDIEEIDGIKGGNISGEDEIPYEIVNYDETSQNEVKIIPNENYEIIKVTINGKEIDFEPADDDSYTLPQFSNLKENKHIVAKFALKTNKLTINKVDSVSGERLEGVKFKVDQIDERIVPDIDEVLGDLVGNSKTYSVTDYDVEVENVLGSLTDNGAQIVTIDYDRNVSQVFGEKVDSENYYFVQNGNQYISNNQGVANSVANSYIPIDLTELSGNYVVVVNASISSQSGYDMGYATITNSTEVPSYNSTSGRFISISGSKTDTDYNSEVLQGGNIYYLHMGYRKNASNNTGDDQFIINSINIYNADVVQYNFIENGDGGYESTNQGIGDSVSNSYIPIDLTSYSGKYAICVNAEISSQSGYDIGYAVVTKNTNRVSYGASSVFMSISGTRADNKYTTYVDGGSVYYLHLGYRKDNKTNTGQDKFTVNGVKVYEAYTSKFDFIQNGNGGYESTNMGHEKTVSSGYIPLDLTGYSGKYNLIFNMNISSESSNDYGYINIVETQTLNNVYTGRITTVSGEDPAKTVSTVVEGGRLYYIHLNYSKNITIDSGNDKFIINSINLELNYSELYHTSIETNHLGQGITQIPFGKYKITEIKTVEGYVLNSTPTIIEFGSGDDAIHEFTIGNEKVGHVIVHHYIKGTTTSLAEDELLEGRQGESYSTLPKAGIENYELEEIDGNLIMPSNRIGQFEHNDIEVIYYYVQKKTPLIVNHYIEGTNISVLLNDGTRAESSRLYGNVDDEYTTEAISNDILDENYELAEVPSNSIGIYGRDEIIVTYYYKEVRRTLTINKYDEDSGTPLENVEFSITDLSNSVMGPMTDNGREYSEIEINPDDKIQALGSISNNGNTYTDIDMENEVTGVLGNLTGTSSVYYYVNYDQEIDNVLGGMVNNGKEYENIGVYGSYRNEYLGALTSNGSYYFENEDGKLVPTNGKTWRIANVTGATAGIGSVTAHSYYKIDLSEVNGNYSVLINASCSSESGCDYGFATITQDTTAPAYNSSTGRFMYISGIVSATDYASQVLTGGNIYYLHLGYRKDGSIDRNDDQVVFNSINIVQINGENRSYYFEENQDGYYVPNNSKTWRETNIGAPNIGAHGTVANSYIPIDLTALTGKYVVVVNASISSQTNDIGYVTVTQSTTAPAYNSSTGRFVYLTGTKGPDDYISTGLNGGSRYYLHLGYRKDNNTDNGEDQIIIRSIKVYRATTKTYSFVENEDGKLTPTNGKTWQEANVENAVGGAQNTVANSYIPINLGSIQGKYYISLNASISSQGTDYGYAAITQSTSAPAYSNTSGRFVYISGENDEQRYVSTELQGGKTYYLHLGYRKDASIDEGDDQFLISNIKLYRSNEVKYGFVENAAGQIVPTNGKSWRQSAYGIVTGVQSTTASSYIPIDLRDTEDYYSVIINASVSSQSGYDCGYAYITTTRLVPDLYSTDGRIIYISGTKNAMDYTSVPLQGGRIYYLHLIYKKDSSMDVDDDQMVINNISICKTNVEKYRYGFNYISDDDKYVSTNQGKDNTVANSYIPIDLREYDGSYTIIVNAAISSASGDYGYATITHTPDAPLYNTSTGRFIYIQGNQSARDYTKTLQGGDMYYLHFGYYKNGSTSSGEDTFTINSINEFKGRKIYRTNQNGIITISLKPGRYSIQETETLNGYDINTQSQTIDISKDSSSQVLNVPNRQTRGKVIVHHYLKGTTTPVPMEDGTDAIDEIKENVVGEIYATKPLDGVNHIYENTISVGQTSGEYINGTIEVTYYYDYKDSQVTVHHYIEGTTTKLSEDVVIVNKITTPYQTSAATDIPAYYELVSEPTNKNGEITYDPIEVIYEYRLKKYPYIVNYYKDGTTEKLAESKNGANTTYGTTIVATDEDKSIYGYKVVGHSIDELTIGMENNIINIYYDVDETQRKDLYYYVEYYKDNTIVDGDTVERTTNVQVLQPDTLEIDRTLINNNNKYDGYRLDHTDPSTVPDVVNDGDVIKVYYVKRTDLEYTIHYKEQETNNTLHEDKVVPNQTFADSVEESAINIPGYDKVEPTTTNIEITTGINEYTFYYKKAKYNYIVEYYYNDVKDETLTDTIEATYLDKITTYTDKVKLGYMFDKTKGLPLSISYDEDENVIEVYYKTDPDQRKDLHYTVEYYKDNILVDGDTITKSSNVQILEPDTITIDRSLINNNNKYDGYKLSNTDPSIVPDIVNDGDVIKVYYTKRTDLSYIIHYKEQGTNKTIAEDKIVGNQVFGSTANESAIEIDGYLKLDPTNAEIEITAGLNEYTFYYNRSKYNYIVEYYYNEVLDDSKTDTIEATYLDEITTYTDKATIGYTLDRVEGTPLVISTNEDENIIKVFYKIDENQRKDLHYTVVYFKDNVLVPEDTVHRSENVQVLEEDTIEVDRSLFTDENKYYGYKINTTKPSTIPGRVPDETIIHVFYIPDEELRKDVKYTVEYYKDGVLTDIDMETDSVQILQPDTIEVNKERINTTDKYENYVLDYTDPEVIPDVVESNSVIRIFYIRRNDLQYVVHYKDEITGSSLADDKVVQGQTFGDKVQESAIDIVGYDKVDPINAEIEITSGTNEYTFYYNRAKYNYTVEYYYDNVIDDSKTEQIESLYHEEIISYTDKVKEGYKLDKVEGIPLTISENEDENIIKVYYVIDPSQTKTIQYIVNYYKDNVLQEADTQYQTQEVQLLSDEELIVDKNAINTTNKYEDYTFVETDPTQIPDTIKNGGVIDVYYTRNKYPYSIEYYYNNIIDTDATESGQGYKGDIIDTYTNKNKDGYEFESVDGLPLVISSTGDNIIKVYYLPIRKITINHIDKNTNEIIKTEEKTGKEGYKIKTSAEDFEGYILLEKPEMEEYTYSENEQIVNYYYAKVSSGVIEKHIDIISGKPLVEDILHEGYTGKAYTTQIKNIDNYEHATNKQYYKMLLEKNPNLLIEAGVSTLEEYLESKGIDENLDYIPANSKGNMTEDLIEVRYYYVPKTKLIVKYVDINTGEEITEEVDGNIVSTTIEKDGIINEEYTTTQKEFDDYIAISNRIYYKNYFKNHPEELKEDSIDEYMFNNNIDPDAPYTPSNSEGTMILINNPDGTYSNETIVTYYYGREREVVVKYYDYNTNEEISEEVVKIGPDGEPYNIEDTKKEIENYTLLEEPDNPTGIYQENNETRKYYYAKNTQVVVKYVDKATGKELTTTKTIDGYVGKGYTTEKEDIDGYNYISSTNNTSGKMTEDILEVVYYYSKPKEKIYSKYIINYIDADTGKPIIVSKEVDKQEVETKIYTKSLVIDIDNYTFENANTDYFVVKENEDTIINLYYSKNETSKEKEPTVINIKIKDDTPANNVKDTTNVKNANNEKPTKDQVRVSNTGKTTYIHIILGIVFIITGCTTIVLNKYYNRKKNNNK